MPKPCPCRTGVSSLRPEAGSTNSGCHGNTAGVSAHQKHIITGPQIVLVLWNDFFVNTQGAAAQATQFVTDLIAGPFMNGLVQYGVSRGAIKTTVTISGGTTKPNKSTWDIGGSDDGDQLVAWLKQSNGPITVTPAINETKLLYVVLLPSTLALTNGTNSDGTPNTNVCGWHHSRKFNDASSANDLFWCVVRMDTADTSSAQNFVDSVAYCAGHEIVEALTDRDGAGWHGDDGNGCEIGDLCEQNSWLGGAQLQGASLDRAQLQGALLFGAQLQGASFDGAVVNAADFSEAFLWRTDWREIDPAKLGAVLLKAATWKPVLPAAKLGDPTLQWDPTAYSKLRDAMSSIPEGKMREEAAQADRKTQLPEFRQDCGFMRSYRQTSEG